MRGKLRTVTHHQLRYLSPWLTESDAIAIWPAIDRALHAVDAELSGRGYSAARFVERMHLNSWCDMFVGHDDRLWPIRTVTTSWFLPISKIRRACSDGDGARPLVIQLARAAAVSHSEKIERITVVGDPAFGIRGLADLLGGQFNVATPEVILREAARRTDDGERWPSARMVIALELDQFLPMWTRDANTLEPMLESILLSRVAGVVPGAVK